MMKKISLSFPLIMLFIVFGLLSCDKYNVVQPRFFSEDDLVDIPWLDSTYSSVAVTMQIPEAGIISVKVVGESGELVYPFGGFNLPADREITIVWNLIDNDSRPVDEGIYGFIFGIGEWDVDEHEMDVQEERQIWFELKYHNNQAEGINYIGEYPEDFHHIGDMVADNELLYVYCCGNIGPDTLNGLLALDYSDIENPEVVSITNMFSSTTRPTTKIGIAPESNYLIFQNNNNIRIYDISDPEQPEYLDNRFASIEDFCIVGNMMYLLYVDDTKTAGIYDLSSTAGPTLTDSLIIDHHQYFHISINNGIAVFQFCDSYNQYGVVLVNVDDPSSAEILATYNFDERADDIELVNNSLYFSGAYRQLSIMDISDISDSLQVGRLGYPAKNLKIFGDRMLSRSDNCVWLLDITDNFNPTSVTFFDNLNSCQSAAVSGNFVFIADYFGDSSHMKLRTYSYNN